MKKLLHVGCGSKYKNRTTAGFNTDQWQEIRFDISQDADPDIVGTMTDMSSIEDGFADALYSSHNIEHLYPHEVDVALREFLRVMKDDGFAVITCPDLQSVCKLVADDQLLEAAYTSPAGPITPLDMLYGHRDSLKTGNLHMAHKCGFTRKVLVGALLSAGFKTVISRRRLHPFYDLFALATKQGTSKEKMGALSAEYLPGEEKTGGTASAL